MPKKKNSHAAKPTRVVINPGMHYSITLALLISNITSLGLAFLMAQMLGVSMGNLVIIGATQSISKANAQVYMTSSHSAAPAMQPAEGVSCDARWTVCSKICEDTYTSGTLTPIGWQNCERDCDLKAAICEKSGQWPDTIQLRDSKFKT